MIISSGSIQTIISKDNFKLTYLESRATKPHDRFILN